MGNENDQVDPKMFTLLIVDDEPDLREILVFQFLRDGFKVLEASNGVEAYNIVKSQKVDLIISDIQMPIGNGIELLDRLRAEDHRLPVVLFVTGFADITVEDAFNKGAEAVFSKPFDRKALLETVKNALLPQEQKWGARSWRGETNLPIELVIPEFLGAREARVINLGRGGIFIALALNIPPVGTKVRFKICFIDETTLHLEGSGIVRWVRHAEGEFPAGCGIEFIDLTNSSKTRVIEFVNSIKTKQYIPKC